MRFVIITVIGVGLLVGGGVFLLREGLPFGQRQAAVSAPAATVSQPPAQSRQAAPTQQVAPVAKPARPTLAEIRAEQEKKEATEEGFKPPPEIKLPDFLGNPVANPANPAPKPQQGAAAQKKSGTEEVVDQLMFPVRAIGWIKDNFWFSLIIAIGAMVIIPKILGAALFLPMKIVTKVVWEFFIEPIFVKRSVAQALEERAKKGRKK